MVTLRTELPMASTATRGQRRAQGGGGRGPAPPGPRLRPVQGLAFISLLYFFFFFPPKYFFFGFFSFKTVHEKIHAKRHTTL